MALPRLPAELLENIVTHALPEGFEGLALTCRRMHAVCTPFIQDHNTLRLRFHSFDYFHDYVERPDDIRTAFEMIARIAVEPVVARYVRHASFENDSRGSWRCAHALVADLYDGGPVVELFAKSPYLTQAGLNWKEYCAKIEKELVATPPFPTHYSQHAAAFLLTLLPNVETLRLPKQWRPVDATNKLVDVVLRKAKQSHNSCQTPSLAQVTRFEPSVSFVPQDRFDLDWATPFLALPHIRSFRGPGCVAIGGDGHNSVATPDSDDFYGKTLEAIDLSGCCIDEVAIADFLKHTVRLRTLRYSHMEKVTRSIKKWDICKFLTAIEHKVGSHLEELSVSAATDALFTPSTTLMRCLVTPSATSMRGFQRLRKLEFPLEIALCNITAGASASIGDLVPVTVSQLLLTSAGTDDHATALDEMFRDFAAKKEYMLPNLKMIQLSFPHRTADSYEEVCARLLAETKKVDVDLHTCLDDIIEWGEEWPFD